MVKLKNLLRQTRVFNLDHPTFLGTAGEHPVGKPETLTLFPLEARDVHDDVIKCAGVKSALAPTNGARPTLRVL